MILIWSIPVINERCIIVRLLYWSSSGDTVLLVLTSIVQHLVTMDPILDTVVYGAPLIARNLGNPTSSSTTSSMASATSSTSAATTTAASTNSSNNGNGPTSSPLLFFVALGFGVVFTNLWIIVGVKYCFRYNQRNRQMRNGEDGEPIDMAVMPRPRRRREKKLMTMDEVNDRFPLTKYKAWRSSRAQEGLPTAGGVTAPPSRAASVKDEVGTTVPAESGTAADSSLPSKERDATETLESGYNFSKEHNTDDRKATASHINTSESSDRSPTAAHSNASVDTVKGITEVEDDDDDPIQTAVPAELLANPGDSCAICLDTIEEDDDVRGLTCGHAFHASCIDPWLTSRRACCPLCKADYYTPKPRPGGVDPVDTERTGRRQRGNMPVQPQYAYVSGASNRGRRPRMVLPGRFMTVVYNENDRFPTVVREGRPRQQRSRGRTQGLEGSNGYGTVQPISWRSRLRNVQLPSFPRRPGNRTDGPQPESAPSPAQLEAGRQ